MLPEVSGIPDKAPAFATKIEAYFIVTLRFVREDASTLRANQCDCTAEFRYLNRYPPPGVGERKTCEKRPFYGAFNDLNTPV